MKLKSIQYKEFNGQENEWGLDCVFNNVNLMVGKNTAGKTRLLNIILDLANLLSGEKKPEIDSGNLEVVFNDNGDEINYLLSYDTKKVTQERLIVNVGNDERVLDVIKEREERLLSKGFTKIIGLRDMYSKAYRKKSKGVIDDEIIQQFIEGVKTSIAKMNKPDNISFHFAIMELETWWLSMYNLFAKINGKLTVSFIETHLGYNLSELDPQKVFFHPAQEIRLVP